MNEVPPHFYRQSAVLPYRDDRGGLEILLITSRRRKRWVLPKGVVELDLDPADSAAKEALEEAGIEGEVAQDSIGDYTYEKWGGTCSVEVFPMRVRTTHESWPESHRGRRWLQPIAAAERVDEPALKTLILDFAASYHEMS